MRLYILKVNKRRTQRVEDYTYNKYKKTFVHTVLDIQACSQNKHKEKNCSTDN